jgi:hypothetical protein
MPAHASHLDRFKPEMPRIPGVNDSASSRAARAPLVRFVTVAAALALSLAVGLGWWAFRANRSTGNSRTASEANAAETLPAAAPLSGDAAASAASSGSQADPRAVARIEDLDKPWSMKRFTFSNPLTHESVPAMIVRLPGVAGNRSEAYWAFSLNAPYERCQLEYVTDLGQLASRYDYRARHPMLLAACSGILYDPLRVGTAPSGAWVRGEIVQGVGIRPPLAIEIRVQGNSILATRME